MFLFILFVLFIVQLFLLTGERKKHRWIFVHFLLLIISLQYTPRSFFQYFSQFAHFAVLVVAAIINNQKAGLWFYCLYLPPVAGFMWLFYSSYAGVINPQWPLLLSAVVLVAAIYLSGLKKKAWRIATNILLPAIVLAAFIVCLPPYTYEKARAKIVDEVAWDLIVPGKKETLATRAGSFCVDRIYVFRFENKDDLIVFSFDPLSGEWNEWYTEKKE